MFREAQTGWQSNPHVGFDAVVSQIIQHRKANPRFNLSTDPDAVAWELEQYTVKRLQGMKGGETYLIGEPSMDFEPPKWGPPQRRKGAAAVADKLKAGLSLMREWIGDGLKPVDKTLAEARGAVCVTCPYNQEPNAAQAVFASGARAVALLIEARNDMNLSTSHDHLLKTCSICSCSLPLKVWAGLNHIIKGTTKDELQRLPDHCWINTESENTKLSPGNRIS